MALREMEKINLKKLYILFAGGNVLLAGVYFLFLRGKINSFPMEQNIAIATGALLLAAILVCVFAAWKWDKDQRTVRLVFRIGFWVYIALTLGQCWAASSMPPRSAVLVQPLVLLILIGEAFLASLVIRFKDGDDTLEPEGDFYRPFDDDEDPVDNDPYNRFVGKFLAGFGGFVFYWMAWAYYWGIPSFMSRLP